MPPKLALKYLLDVEQLIAELEELVFICERDFLKFNTDFMATPTAERNPTLKAEIQKHLGQSHEK